MFDEVNQEILLNDIVKACKDLKSGRSGGPDFVINEFFKHAPNLPLTVPSSMIQSGYIRFSLHT